MNEPVAWFEQDPDMKSVWYQADKDAPNAIPLYTHPAKHDLGIAEAIGFDKGYQAAKAKTLTDEEILQEAWYILATQWQRKAQEK